MRKYIAEIRNIPPPYRWAFTKGLLRGRWRRAQRALWVAIVNRLGGVHDWGKYTLVVHDDGLTFCVHRIVRWDWFGPWSPRRLR